MVEATTYCQASKASSMLALGPTEQLDPTRQGSNDKTGKLIAICLPLMQMCYIVVINALLLSDTGGPCDASDCTV